MLSVPFKKTGGAAASHPQELDEFDLGRSTFSSIFK